LKNLLSTIYKKDVNNLYFIGIGGSSMSGLAEMAIKQGFTVMGSDGKSSPGTEKLKKLGAIVHIGQKCENITEDIDVIIYSAAIHGDNPERIRASELAIPQVERSSYLGLLSRVFKKTIGVSGTHGKTTTSSMLAALLHNANFDPSVSIGGNVAEIGGNACLGKSDYFVIESCEFVDSFLKTQHYIGIITNIEEDHLDYFTGGLPQIKASFHKFAQILPEDGLMIAWGDSKAVLEVVKDLKCPVITYGLEPSIDWTARNIIYDTSGNPEFDAYFKKSFYGHFKLTIPGQHNVLNALSVIACSHFLKIKPEATIKSLSTFMGAKRRFELRGTVDDIHVYTDYAHHPTELKVVIDAALNHQHNHLWIVFQPHSYSRTHFLYNDMVDSFAKAEKIILNDIYSDRETNEWNIYSEDLAKNIKAKYHIPTIVLSEFETITKYLTDNLQSGDLVLVIGAGTINKVADMLVDRLKLLKN